MMLYIHIPFCKQKCAYCAFYSEAGAARQTEYVDRLTTMISHYRRPFRTVYIGGGTPSVLPIAVWRRLLGAIAASTDVSALEEFTVELNPESTTPELLTLLKENGVNRLSFGVQSLEDAELSAIGRLHDARTALSAIAMAQKLGFDNIGADLIYGLPGQSNASFADSLRRLLATGITHLSCYNLQLEEGTPLYRNASNLTFPDEDEQLAMYQTLLDQTRQAGFCHYEISNFCKQGYRARHNSGYWTGEDYIGLGPGAHSKLGQNRYAFSPSIDAFLQKRDFDFDECEPITPADAREEAIMLGLRTDFGAPLSLVDLTKAHKYVAAGLAVIDGERLRLNDEGMLLSNTVISDLF